MSQYPGGVERRRHPRVEYPFMVRYQSRRRPGTWRMAPLHNLSVCGARFLCECPFEIGEALDLELILPSAKEPVTLKARVVWSKVANAALSLHEYGVAFEALTPGQEATIHQVVSHLLRTPKG